ncbi:hypothetical protein [Planctomycetes bacterium Poly30]
MPVIDDDPVTPDALNGLFMDARELGRHVQVFALAISGPTGPGTIDRAVLIAVEALAARKDIETCTGSITVLMNGETAGVLVAQPQGAPGLKVIGEHLVQSLAGQLGDGVQVAIGMATTAEHKDLDVDDAIAVAMEGLEVASASGANRAVHSELYELTLATRRRRGTVYPLESVQHGDEHATIPSAKPARQAPFAPVEVETRADTPPPVDRLGEFDDPFAHLASEAYELGAESATALTNGIAPKSEIVAKLEQESRAEIERLRLELDLARREKLESAAKGAESDKQERRIAKLVHQLEQAESEIERLRAESAKDPGVPSKFRAVQGLDPNEPTAPVKRTIIDGVFQANRAEKPKDRAAE